MADRGGSHDVAARSAATAALNLAWSEAFVAALIEAGVRDACISSGSRSAPLTLALHRSGIRTHVPLDERAGAFFALGLAKASRRPVAIVCTSGTAAANFYPAILEARHARVPLVVLTADRPPELRDTGAAQTVDQLQMYGTAVRWFFEVGTPTSEIDFSRYVSSLAARAAATAWGPPAGPVHLNFAFREPLLPDPETLGPAPASGARAARESAGDGAPGPRVAPPSPRDVSYAARVLRAKRRGLIACGPDDAPPEFGAAVARLASVTGYPVLADPASQVRYGAHDTSRVLGTYDAFLRSDLFSERESPEVILQFGAPLTSKAFHSYAARHTETIHLLVDPAGEWRSPSRRAWKVLVSDPTEFAAALADALAKAADPLPSWGQSFAQAERAAREVLAARAARRGGPAAGAPGTPYTQVLEALPDGSVLYVGNSMAIRDLDLFAPASTKRVRVLANRGVNGIDGLVSASLGAAAAGEAPVLLITGDLSFHHDLTGLSAARAGGNGATIVIVNDDGGGIFSYLPVSRHRDAFEPYFATPHGLEFSHAAALYSVPYSRPESPEELRDAVSRALAGRGTEIVEIDADRHAGPALRHEICAEVARAVEESK